MDVGKEKQAGGGQDVKVRGSPTRCPYCHESTDTDTEAGLKVCRECLGRHHTDCWGELGRCASCECTEALEQAPDEVDVDLCHCCGVRSPSTAYTCPVCRHGTCTNCYRTRFRRCAECAGELLQQTKRLEQLQSTLGGSQALTVIAVIVGLSFISLIATALAGEVAPWLGVLGLVLVLGFGSLAFLSSRRSARIKEQAEKIELELARFPEPTFGERLRDGTSKLFSRLFG